mgnify:CR=1 FL=1
MRRLVFALLPLAVAAATPALADDACRKAVEDAFNKQRQSKAFTSEVTYPADENGATQMFEYLPPMTVHRTVSTPGMQQPMETIGFGNRAWILEITGWMEMQPQFAEQHKQHLEDMFGANLPGTGGWSVGGQRIDPAALPCPLLNIVSSRDRIVPAASAPDAGDSILLDQGHVGMVTGRRAASGLWSILAQWITARPY